MYEYRKSQKGMFHLQSVAVKKGTLKLGRIVEGRRSGIIITRIREGVITKGQIFHKYGFLFLGWWFG